jgi:rhodanese-related sulfurtransferase
MKKLLTGISAMALVLSAGMIVPASAGAVDVMLTDYLAYLEVEQDGKPVRIQRIQDQDNVLNDGFAKTSRKCPPFCIQPMQVAPGVTTVGEAEIFSFMERQLKTGEGLIIDARTPSWYEKGTIPGSINIPFTVFDGEDTDPATAAALEKVGGVRRGEVSWLTRKFEQAMAPMGWFGADRKTANWDYTNAKQLVLWCNGPWCGQSPRAIQGLLAHGFPAGNIAYYRGGMQMWKILGLTTVVPDSSKAVALK